MEVQSLCLHLYERRFPSPSLENIKWICIHCSAATKTCLHWVYTTKKKSLRREKKTVIRMNVHSWYPPNTNIYIMQLWIYFSTCTSSIISLCAHWTNANSSISLAWCHEIQFDILYIDSGKIFYFLNCADVSMILPLALIYTSRETIRCCNSGSDDFG